MGYRRIAPAQGQCGPLPRARLLGRSQVGGRRGRRRAARPGSAHWRVARRAAQPQAGPDGACRGRTALPHGRRFHDGLGVLGAPGRLVRLHVAVVPRHHRLRCRRLHEPPGPAHRHHRRRGPGELGRASSWRRDVRAAGPAGIPHSHGGGRDPLDRPRLLAGCRGGRRQPGHPRLEPRHYREKAVGGRPASRLRGDPPAPRPARGRQHLHAGAIAAGGRHRGSSRDQRRHAVCRVQGAAGGAHVEHRAAAGGNRRRQGARRAGDSRRESPPGPPARHTELRGVASFPHRERALRA